VYFHLFQGLLILGSLCTRLEWARSEPFTANKLQPATCCTGILDFGPEHFLAVSHYLLLYGFIVFYPSTCIGVFAFSDISEIGSAYFYAAWLRIQAYDTNSFPIVVGYCSRFHITSNVRVPVRSFLFSIFAYYYTVVGRFRFSPFCSIFVTHTTCVLPSTSMGANHFRFPSKATTRGFEHFLL